MATKVQWNFSASWVQPVPLSCPILAARVSYCYIARLICEACILHISRMDDGVPDISSDVYKNKSEIFTQRFDMSLHTVDFSLMILSTTYL